MSEKQNLIPLFIASKDRPTQLKLLLESIERNAPDFFQINVLYSGSLYSYQLGYRKLQSEVSNVNWIEEKTDWKYGRENSSTPLNIQRKNGVFIEQFYDLLEANKDDVFCLMVDDNIVYNKVPISPDDARNVLDEKTFSFSFRLGRNTTIQNHLDGQPQLPLNIEKESGEFIKWNWHNYNNNFTDYAFPFSWDGVIYRTSDIIALLDGTDLDYDPAMPDSWKKFPLPHRLESYMGAAAEGRMSVFGEKNMICSLNQSCVVGMDYNKVIDVDNKGGAKFGANENDLCTIYLLGKCIDYDSIDFSDIKSAHDELPFKLKES